MKNETTLRSQLSVSEEATEATHLPIAAIQELHRHWVFFFALGVALMALGIVATLTAGLSTIVAVDFVGWMLATRPELSAIALTLVIAISFVVQGAFRIGAVLSTRIDGWGSLLASG